MIQIITNIIINTINLINIPLIIINNHPGKD